MTHPAATSEQSQAETPTRRRSRLSSLGAYGFEAQESVILAALVTGDPLLLIGRSGTGKTFLLNSISEALRLAHRHYNASLISFDDLVGFPYPDEDKTAIRFLETPATIWGAESVLIDEISRCKPEHQNRLFSLIHERRIQGLALDRLRYRWAAMNPCSSDQSSGEDYVGAEALDAALADRFAVILEVGDWDTLSEDDRRRVADPARGPRGKMAGACGRSWQAGRKSSRRACRRGLDAWSPTFLRLPDHPGARLSEGGTDDELQSPRSYPSGVHIGSGRSGYRPGMFPVACVLLLKGELARSLIAHFILPEPASQAMSSSAVPSRAPVTERGRALSAAATASAMPPEKIGTRCSPSHEGKTSHSPDARTRIIGHSLV